MSGPGIGGQGRVPQSATGLSEPTPPARRRRGCGRSANDHPAWSRIATAPMPSACRDRTTNTQAWQGSAFESGQTPVRDNGTPSPLRDAAAGQRTHAQRPGAAFCCPGGPNATCGAGGRFVALEPSGRKPVGHVVVSLESNRSSSGRKTASVLALPGARTLPCRGLACHPPQEPAVGHWIYRRPSCGGTPCAPMNA